MDKIGLVQAHTGIGNKMAVSVIARPPGGGDIAGACVPKWSLDGLYRASMDIRTTQRVRTGVAPRRGGQTATSIWRRDKAPGKGATGHA
ncbi:hypothetical protein WMF39_49865 [Sorangium sp. So ce1504]|uniref:hypothetical protein n=1 Tax=Sorangium sp. So ce1504 TaxID=3133337 RepID=UPI003F5E6D67